jgi:hypothetical protein
MPQTRFSEKKFIFICGRRREDLLFNAVSSDLYVLRLYD